MTDNSDLSRVLAKIEKLLAMAEDSRGNPNEAANALRQAEALMRKHNLSRADVTMREIESGEAEYTTHDSVPSMKPRKGSAPPLKRIPPWAQTLAVNVAKLYECHVKIRVLPDNSQTVRFFGMVSDVKVCGWAYDFIVNELRVGVSRFNESIGGWDFTASDSYREGFVAAVCNSIELIIEERETEVQASATGTALVVAKAAGIEEHFEMNFAYPQRERESRFSANAFRKGVDDGRKVNVSQGAISGTQAPQQLKGN
jgi:hypothetical protein